MRYLPLNDTQRREMLGAIGVSSVDALFRDLPKAALASAKFSLPNTASEIEVERALGTMAAKNLNCGAGPSFWGRATIVITHRHRWITLSSAANS